MEEATSEKLLTFIKKELERLLKEYDEQGDPSSCDSICEALELCNKLLEEDYFKDSEKVIDDFSKDKDIKKTCTTWGCKYVKALANKKKDLRKLFAIIVDNIEDWC